MPGAGIDAWYEAEAFNAHFRGDAERHRRALSRSGDTLRGLQPGARRRLRARRVPRSAARDRRRRVRHRSRSRASWNGPVPAGLQADVGRAVEYLGGLDDDALGGLVMIQVIEHLSPQHVIDVVRLAADKVRPGGRVVVETVNPMSLYTYAHAFWVDPDHVRPVHPNYLGFLFAEAGFASVERVDRSPVPADESLELLPGDDELSKRLNANFDRINALAVRAAGLRHRRHPVSRRWPMTEPARCRHPPGARRRFARRRDHEPRARQRAGCCAGSGRRRSTRTTSTPRCSATSCRSRATDRVTRTTS